MKFINAICDNITNYLASELKLNEEKSQVVEYGVFAIIQMMINIMCVIIIGMFFGVVTEALIISFVVSILRKSSGGVHASSPEKCIVIGTTFSICLALISQRISLSCIGVCAISSAVFIWAYYLVYKLAPVDSENKPIRSVKKRERLKKSSLIILSIYLLIAILCLLIFVFTEKMYLLSYILCICFGIVWQVFSLTKLGHFVLNI